MKVLFCKKRILTMFLAMVLAIGMIPSSTFAAIALDTQIGGDSVLEDSSTPNNNTNSTPELSEVTEGYTDNPVARIGNKGYETLQMAIDEANPGDTVTLLKNVSLGSYAQGNTIAAITIKKAITLDGNGFTLTSGFGRAINVKLDGTANENDVEIKNLTIKQYCGRNGNDDKRCVNVITNSANVTIKNCNFGMIDHYVGTYHCTSYVAGVYAYGPSHNITIDECNFSTIYGVRVYAEGTTINIKNSNISNALYGMWINAECDVDIENSTITTKENMGTNNLAVALLVQAADVSVIADENTKINVPAPKGEDGTQTGGQGYALYSSQNYADLGEIKIEAEVTKTADSDPVIYLANAEVQIYRADGTVMFDTLDDAIEAIVGGELELDGSVIEGLAEEIDIEEINKTLEELGSDITIDENGEIEEPNDVVEVDGVGYESLTDALAAAKTNDTITFLADINENVTIDEAVTIDGAGFKYTGTINITGNVKVMIEDIAFEKGYIKQNGKAEENELHVKDCSFTSGGYAVETAGINSVIIENCTVVGQSLLYARLTTSNIVVKNTTVERGNYLAYICYGSEAYFEGVTATDMNYYGICAQNYGEKTITLKNCYIEAPIYAIASQDVKTNVDTFVFVGDNTVNTVYNNQYNKLVLTAGATLKAPEGLTVTSANDGYSVKYEDGKYFVKANMVAIGNETYASLAEALAAAKTNDTITFLNNIEENVTINKAVTIDGNGKQYTGTMTVGAYEITIQNVKFVNGEIVKTTAPISGTFRINDCTFEGETTSGYAIKIGYASLIEINGCESKGNSFLYVPYSLTNLSVSNTTIENANWAIHLVSIDSPVFTNVTIKNSNCGIVIQNTGNKKITIDGCTFTDTVKPIVIWEKQTNNVKFTFKGNTDLGTNGNVWAIANNNYVSDPGSQYAELVLAVGATLTAPEGLTVTSANDGYSVKYEDGKYFVKANMVAIGNETYASLAEALEAAKDGDTITFLADITEDVTFNKNITINGADFNYTGKIKISGNADVTITNVNFVKGYVEQNGTETSATLTVKGCSFTNGGYAITTERIKNLIIEDCTVTNQSLLYAKLATLNIVVKNVTVTGGNYVAHIVYGNTALFENVEAKEMTGYGIFTQNYGSKTITIRNCKFDTPKYTSIGVNETRSDAVDTFIFEEDNTMTSLENVFAAKYVLGTSDATLTAPANCNVTTNVDRYVVKYVGGVYQLVEAVAQIGTTYYDSLQAAIAAAETNDTIVILKKITVDAEKEAVQLGSKYKTLFNITGKSITIDLNGNTLYCDSNISGMLIGFFATENGGHLTLKDSSADKTGKVEIKANSTTVYCLLTAFDSTARMTIEGGNYILDNASNSLVYADGDETIIVKDGNFRLGNIGTGSNGSPWIFNTSGQNTKNIIVNGGTFNANVMKQYYEFEVQSEKPVACVEVESGIWKISAATVLLGEKSTSSEGYTKWIGYETFEEAYNAADEGETIKLLADIKINLDMTKDVTILKGYDYEVTIQNAKFYAGTYDWDVTNYVANGYCVKAEEGTWNVHAHIRAERNENEHAPTCDSDGYYELVVYCECCNTEFSRTQITITATGHTKGEVQIENKTDATCDAAGAYHKVIYCTVCNKELEREHVTIPALGHTKGEVVKRNEVGATCDTDGYYEEVVYCATCKEPMSSTIIKTEDAHNHKITMEMDPATGFVLTFYFDACNSVKFVNINGTEVAIEDCKEVSDNRYSVTYNEILAKDIDKTIYVQLISDKVVSQIENISVANYIEAELNKTDISDEYRKLLEAMLNYGAAAEAYLKGNYSDRTVSGEIPYTDHYAINGNDEYFADISVSGQSMINIKFLFDFRDVEFAEGESPNFALNTNKFAYEAVENKEKPGVWMVSVEVPAYCMSEAITCVATAGEYNVSVTYSVETYAFEAYLFEDLNYRCDLVDAMMAYGNAAKAYAEKN